MKWHDILADALARVVALALAIALLVLVALLLDEGQRAGVLRLLHALKP